MIIKNFPLMKFGILFILFSQIFFAQNFEESQKNKNSFSVTSEYLAGASLYSKQIYADDSNNFGFVGTVRFMWEPDRLLRIGLETGFIHLAHSKEENIETEFGITNRANSLNAFPLTLIFNMKIMKIELILGIGASLIQSKINAFDEISESSVITSAKLFGVGYSFPLSENSFLGTELKYFVFSTPEISSLAIQLKYKIRIYKW